MILTIELALELKAIQLKYSTWQALKNTYLNCKVYDDYIPKFTNEAKGWVETGVPEIVMAEIEDNIQNAFDKEYIKQCVARIDEINLTHQRNILVEKFKTVKVTAAAK